VTRNATVGLISLHDPFKAKIYVAKCFVSYGLICFVSS
jgi:hypothetical protein